MSYVVNTLPHLDLSSNSITSNDLANIDPDNIIPSQSNFRYCTTSEFINNQQIQSCTFEKHFSVNHSNIGVWLLILTILHKC